MAWKNTHKEESRQRILQAAGALFTRKGFNQVGIDEVMLEAGMTRGAFYAHFNSKIELYEEAIVSASKTAAARFNADAISVDKVIEDYLSEDHLLAEDMCCPLACLVSDVAHDDARVKKTYTRVFKGFSNHLQHISAQHQTEENILLQTVLMVGGMTIARSLTDKTLAQKILTLCCENAKSLTVNPNHE